MSEAGRNLKTSELYSIFIKTEIRQQIGIDICSLPETDGLKHLVVCINYFSKWSTPINPLQPGVAFLYPHENNTGLYWVKSNTASTITQFLYEVICQYGCMKIQIYD